uniref:Uncharacterized protein n=1 Tax=Arundo donax TaxID=35708 RepID=A0A0A9BY06_ARUDO
MYLYDANLVKHRYCCCMCSPYVENRKLVYLICERKKERI